MGEIPYTGTLKIGHNVQIGYFAQNQAQMLDGELTVFETIDNVATGDMRTKVRDILGAFMFGGEASDKKVKVLSGGEKTRLAMIRLLLEPVNFLILDEPTNHLDIKTKEILKEAIRDFGGTVIVVSHDRYFLDGLVEKVYEFGDGKVRENIGGIYEFLSKKNLDSLNQLELTKSTKRPVTGSDTQVPEESGPDSKESRKLSYAEQKERAKAVSRAEKEVKAAEAEIGELEKKLGDFEDKMSAGNASPEVLSGYENTQKALEEAMTRWEEASSLLEELSK